MNEERIRVPIFALDSSANWEDFENAVEASVRYQSSTFGKFGPMFAFAPMTEPDDPDTWEPLDTPPLNLLIASIERHQDARLLKAFQEAEDKIGPLIQESPTSPVRMDDTALIADVYDQMEEGGLIAFCRLVEHKDDISFFFVRGTEAILALNQRLVRHPQ